MNILINILYVYINMKKEEVLEKTADYFINLVINNVTLKHLLILSKIDLDKLKLKLKNKLINSSKNIDNKYNKKQVGGNKKKVKKNLEKKQEDLKNVVDLE